MRRSVLRETLPVNCKLTLAIHKAKSHFIGNLLIHYRALIWVIYEVVEESWILLYEGNFFLSVSE